MQVLRLPDLLILGLVMSSTVHAAAGLFGGKWLVESVRGVRTFDKFRTELSISKDGKLGTTVGCNRMVGKAKIDGDRLTVGRLASTRKACPPPLMELEGRYAAALGATRSFRIEGRLLKFVDGAGHNQIVFTRTR
jgi:heat shock protein HslJ